MRQQIPTWLTLMRIVMLPIIVVVFYIDAIWARPLSCLLFSIAGATDWLDGYLARRWKTESRFGAFLDPVADKLLVATVLILIVEFDHTPWLTIPAVIIIGREITISALREWMAEMGGRNKVAVGWIGKLKTTVQMIALGCLLFNLDFLGLPIYRIGIVGLYVRDGADRVVDGHLHEGGVRRHRAAEDASRGRLTRPPAGTTIRGALRE